MSWKPPKQNKKRERERERRKKIYVSNTTLYRPSEW
jgi:hypothetical protein